MGVWERHIHFLTKCIWIWYVYYCYCLLETEVTILQDLWSCLTGCKALKFKKKIPPPPQKINQGSSGLTPKTYLYTLADSQFCHPYCNWTLPSQSVRFHKLPCVIEIALVNCFESLQYYHVITKDPTWRKAVYGTFTTKSLCFVCVQFPWNIGIEGVYLPEGWSHGQAPEPAGKQHLHFDSVPQNDWRDPDDTPLFHQSPGQQRSAP